MRLIILFLFLSATSYAQDFDSLVIRADEMGKKFTRKIFNRSMILGVYHLGQDSIVENGRINFLGRKADSDDIYQIGSITKTFTGLLLAKEIQEGAFSLEESISPYLDIKNKTKYDSVTIKQLVTHTSGLPSNTIAVHGPTIGSYVGSVYLTNGILRVLNSPEIFISLPWQIAVLSPPIPYFSLYGKKSLNFDLRHARLKKYGEWKYSNVGMGVLGNIISEKKQQSYEETLQNEVLIPLSMTSTSTEVKKLKKSNFATPHNLFGMKMFRTKLKKGGMEGAGNIKSTGKDMMTYLRAQLGQSDNLQEAIQSQHETLYKATNEKSTGLEMGMGWIKYVKEGQPTIIWHNGQVTGSSSFIGFMPEENLGIFILTNHGKSQKLAKMGFKYLLMNFKE